MPFKEVLRENVPVDDQRPRRPTLYPSGASIKDRMGDVQGGCNRNQWFRLMGYKKTEPSNFSGKANMAMGIAIETEVIAHLKRTGRWIANSIKLYDAETNLSGEVDIIAYNDDGVPVIVECKTFSGGNMYARKGIMGSKDQLPKPKFGHVLQLAIYLFIRDRASITDTPWSSYDPNTIRDHLTAADYGVLLYVDRNDPKVSSEFRVSVMNGSICYRHEKSSTPVLLCHIEDILSRSAELMDYYHAKTPPPRDYEGQYSREKLAEMNRLGQLTPRERDIFADAGSVSKGDWMCRARKNRKTKVMTGEYCDFWKLCKSVDDGIFIPTENLMEPFVSDPLPADDQIVEPA